MEVDVPSAIVENDDELQQISLCNVARSSWILQHVNDCTGQLIILISLFLSKVAHLIEDLEHMFMLKQFLTL